ncbi:Esterase/lipase [Streptococcus sp. DD10]|uniref:DUF2974 domain-containing protein n=1 Tax=Streptococcus sp. DD10 TaxID=1777878 RepID=UPI00079B940E|nr:DUF2974 domain-containing protein [Streptococcus sp. DD10]KXT73349.1 Esterase/lipase [Streptococcus sp. DD10]
MPNLFDYLKTVTNESIYDSPFTELDILALTEITYLNFDNLELKNSRILPEKRLLEIAPKIPRDITIQSSKERLLLLDELASSTRFKNIKLMGYTNEVDFESEKQFAAMTYRLSLDTYLVVFRGTDASIIGWKEDFHMTYMNHIPAQKSATRYLNQIMATYPNAHFLVAGHSKGGNLATYAATFIDEELQERVESIYCFDAPGLHKNLIKTPSYQQTSKKILSYIPKNSIVGMMLETPEPAQIVASNAFNGLSQHNTFSWQVEKNHFETVDAISKDSQQTDATLKKWVAQVPDEELKDFFDSFFGLILDTGMESLDELKNPETITKVLEVFRNAHDLSPEKKTYSIAYLNNY